LSCFLGSSTQDRFVVDGHSQPRVSRWHLAGQIVDHRIEAHFERAHEILFCELAATAHHRLFGIPGEAFVGAAPALGSVRPDCESLARECFAAGPDAAWSERIGEANLFFSRLAEKALSGDPAAGPGSGPGAVRSARGADRRGEHAEGRNAHEGLP
jgi:hypothetical protein